MEWNQNSETKRFSLSSGPLHFAVLELSLKTIDDFRILLQNSLREIVHGVEYSWFSLLWASISNLTEALDGKILL